MVVYVTRAACTCVECLSTLPAGTWACAVARGMSCLPCASVDERHVATVMEWNARRARFERRSLVVVRTRRPARPKLEGEALVSAFAARIRAEFRAMPPQLEKTIAEQACVKGRVGRSRAARAVLLAVCAHVRHCETRYDALLASGAQVWQARKAVQPVINEVLARWRG